MGSLLSVFINPHNYNLETNVSCVWNSSHGVFEIETQSLLKEKVNFKSFQDCLR